MTQRNEFPTNKQALQCLLGCLLGGLAVYVPVFFILWILKG